MRLKCPNCQAVLNLLDETLDQEASCPSCGSKVAFCDATRTYRPLPKGRVGHFSLLEEVGKGQFGSVWRARDLQLGRTVAVKIPRREELDDRSRQMLLREAKAAASLNHPNVVRLYEVLEEEGHVYIVSEFIKGDTLKSCLEARRYSFREAAEFMAMTSLAVDYAHEAGVIHRDLKPANILVDGQGEPHVTDFGIAKQVANEITMTVTGDLLGTPAYMSPEQAGGEGHRVDRRSDVFSLGVILYEILTGQRPFQGLSTALLKQIQSADPRAPRTIDKRLPRDLETICLKALSKERERRYATAKDLADDLRRFLSGAAIKARPTSLVERGARWVRRNLALATVGLVALSSSAAALALVHQGPQSPDAPLYPPGSRVEVTSPVKVDFTTVPAGASLALFPRDEITGEPRAENIIYSAEKTPCTLDLLPGDYLVVAKLDDGRFHEVYRHVPKDSEAIFEPYSHRMWTRNATGRISVPQVKIPDASIADEMAFFSGSPRFQVGVADSPMLQQHVRSVAAFYMDTHEVTISEFRERFAAEFPGFDATFPGNFEPPEPRDSDDVPMTGTYFDYCVLHAERVGKRLPTEFEYEFAATNGGTTRFPWGNEQREIPLALTSVRHPDFDRTATTPAVYGLFSNGAEFTDSLFFGYANDRRLAPLVSTTPSGNLTIRGGASGDSQVSQSEIERIGPRIRLMASRKPAHRDVNNQVGFRCARSMSPRW